VIGYTPPLFDPEEPGHAVHQRRRMLSRREMVFLLLALPIACAAPAAPAEGSGAQSGPSVAQLLAACARAEAAGFAGIDAALCEWYAVPCDCSAKSVPKSVPKSAPESAPESAAPRWCLPAEVSIDAALPRVLAALRAEPRQADPARLAVPAVMARLYPCPAPAER
jgi:hypothetical protein